jgi:hypothetical protein
MTSQSLAERSARRRETAILSLRGGRPWRTGNCALARAAASDRRRAGLRREESADPLSPPTQKPASKDSGGASDEHRGDGRWR